MKRFFGRQEAGSGRTSHPSRCYTYGASSVERNPSGESMSQAGDHRTNLLQVEAVGSGNGARGADPAAAVGRREQKLKALVADLTLDKHMLQEVLRKKVLKPVRKRLRCSFCAVVLSLGKTSLSGAKTAAVRLLLSPPKRSANRTAIAFERPGRGARALRLRTLSLKASKID